MAKKKQLGIGAICTVLTRFIHPRPVITEKYPNAGQNSRTEGLKVIRKEVKVVNRRDQECAIMQHADMIDVELHAVMRYCNVTTEGPCSEFFVADGTPTEEVENEPPAVDEGLDPVPIVPTLTGDLREDIARLRMEGFEVDDDNDPAEENIPTATQPTENELESMGYQDWDSKQSCNRKAEGHVEENPRLLKTPAALTRLGYFILFLPQYYIKEVLIAKTSEEINGADLSLGEFLRYIGLWLLMSSQLKANVREYFSTSNIDPYSSNALFRLTNVMSYNRFCEITRALTYTDLDPPNYRDKFHEVRQMLTAFNDHMRLVFLAGWVSCLDESMSIWTRRWTCPGWMFVPRKPHPKGNEYHSICCSFSGIMYGIEIVEGKDRPRQLNKPEYHEKGATASLLLRLCKPLFATGKLVILDSGFCVLQALLTLKQYGVFASAVIKKRRYWPKNIPAEIIKKCFDDKAVGDCHRLPGDREGIKFDVFAHKEPDYITMFMSTYGSCIERPNQQISRRTWVEGNEVKRCTFRYKEVTANHYLYRGSVDAHNRWRHDGGANQGLSLEETWDTKRWENRVFSFVIAIAEVNAYLAMKQFQGLQEDFITFRRKLSQELVHNTMDQDASASTEQRRSKRRKQTEHKLLSIPPYCKYVGGKWKKVYKRKYQQKYCSTAGCKTRTRYYCPCSPDIFRCVACYSEHIINNNIDEDSIDGNPL